MPHVDLPAAGRHCHVCPWWKGYLLDNLLRRLLHPPRLFASFVRPGAVVHDIGSGMGALTFLLAELVGPAGRVHAVDVQEKMLAPLRRRIVDRGLADRVFARLVEPDRLELPEPADVAVCFWMIHEVPDQARFFDQLRVGLKPGGLVLAAEPAFHVASAAFAAELRTAEAAGFVVTERPAFRLSRAALLRAE